MNIKTFCKLSEHILNQNYNYSNQNTTQKGQKNHCLPIQNVDKNQQMQRRQIIKLKKENLKKIQLVSAQKQRQMQKQKDQFEKQKKQIIQKYEKILSQKQQYIKILEQIYGNDQNQNTQPKLKASAQQIMTRQSTSRFEIKQKQGQRFYYTHQAPLYNQIRNVSKPNSQFDNTNQQPVIMQKLRNKFLSRSSSFSKTTRMNMNSQKQVSNRAQSKKSNKHSLLPAFPPVHYFKIY